MKSEWKEKKLGDVLTLKRGYDLPKQNRVEGEYPILSSSGINGYNDVFKVHGPGVVTGRSGQLGKVFFSESDFWPLNTTLYVQDFKGNDPKFIYYFLQTLNLSNFNTGSSVPTLNRNHVHLLEVQVPDFEVQKEIANILGGLDSKIELNNQMIATLEELASTLFKRWFVDFEFPDENGNPYKSSGGKMVDSELGEIPEGWEVKSLTEIASYKNGLAMQKFRPIDESNSLPVLKIKELNQGFVDSSSDRCSIDIKDDVKVFNGDVIFSWSGTLLVKLWTGGNAGLNQHLFKVTSDQYGKWFYFLWTKHYLNQFVEIAKDKATTMGHIKRENLSNSKVCYPTMDELWKMFSGTFSGLIDKLIELGLENNALKDTRDGLLPMLLHGKFEV